MQTSLAQSLLLPTATHAGRAPADASAMPSVVTSAMPSGRADTGPVTVAPRRATARPAGPTVAMPRRLRSHELLDGEREIEIEHAGAVYRLRRTSLGKLILTK